MNLAFYCVLFTIVGVGFILVHLVAGKLIRPNRPGAEKKTTYECGEPTIGSAWIQFDLRFYVIALLFVIFDVEVAFFFPWAEVFGRANDVAHVNMPTVADKANPTPGEVAAYADYCRKALALSPRFGSRPTMREAYERLATDRDDQFDADRALVDEDLNLAGEEGNSIQQAHSLAWMAFLDILVFFGVLLVGFAYLWRRGDLAWVRSVSAEQPAPPPEPIAATPPLEPELAAPVSAH